MISFSISEKTGFTAFDRVKIYKGGNLFYLFNKKGKIRFNLPAGEYVSSYPIEKQKRPFKVKVKSERKRENFHYKAPKEGLKVVYTDNPNKASILPFEGLIKIDNRYKDFSVYPEYVSRYLILHEIGHYHYNTESWCDEFARDKMLEEGYNLSQIEEASKRTLFHGHERHVKCLEAVAKAKIL